MSRAYPQPPNTPRGLLPPAAHLNRVRDRRHNYHSLSTQGHTTVMSVTVREDVDIAGTSANEEDCSPPAQGTFPYIQLVAQTLARSGKSQTSISLTSSSKHSSLSVYPAIHLSTHYILSSNLYPSPPLPSLVVESVSGRSSIRKIH